MKHFLKLKKFNIEKKYRNSMFYNMCNSLIKYEFIKTTIQKSKVLSKFLNNLIIKSKIYKLDNIRYIYSKIKNLNSVFKLFKIISYRYKYLNSGFFKIYKIGFRKGDNSKIVLLKFI